MQRQVPAPPENKLLPVEVPPTVNVLGDKVEPYVPTAPAEAPAVAFKTWAVLTVVTVLALPAVDAEPALVA